MIKPRVFVKPGCPWCEEAEDFLKSRGVAYERVNVMQDPIALQEMIRLSGQRKAPTLEWEGEVLADFGVEELEDFLQRRDLV